LHGLHAVFRRLPPISRMRMVLSLTRASNSLRPGPVIVPRPLEARVARTTFELKGDAAWWRRAASRPAAVGRAGLPGREKALTPALGPCAGAWLKQGDQTAVAAR